MEPHDDGHVLRGEGLAGDAQHRDLPVEGGGLRLEPAFGEVQIRMGEPGTGQVVNLPHSAPTSGEVLPADLFELETGDAASLIPVGHHVPGAAPEAQAAGLVRAAGAAREEVARKAQ